MAPDLANSNEMTMSKTLICLAVGAFMLGAVPGRAQEVKATAADSVLVAGNVYNRLFDGIVLSSVKHERALAIIRKDFIQKVALQGHFSERWAKATALTVQRDSLLKALISSPAERQKFEQRAVADRPSPPPA
jgi:hypothetical protein